MPTDLRFFDFLGQASVARLAELTGAEIRGDPELEIDGVASSANAGPGTVCFHDAAARKAADVNAEAAACFVTADGAEHLPESICALVTRWPRWAHCVAGEALFRVRAWDSGDLAAEVHETARISPGVFIGRGAAIGEGTVIGPNSAIGPGVQIGRNCQIEANVSIRCSLIGDGVKILSGARLGENGFGVTPGPNGAYDIPQWGRVIVQDGATIGANTCIDRGALSDTIIGERTKIDNLCQIAHNVVLGRDVLIASFGGISGSVDIGDGTIIGGRVGIADHVNIGAGAQLAAAAGIFRDIPAGEAWGGIPAKPLRQWLREVSWLNKQVTAKRPSD